MDFKLYTVVVRRGDEFLLSCAVERPRVSLGSRATCDVCVPDPAVPPIAGFFSYDRGMVSFHPIDGGPPRDLWAGPNLRFGQLIVGVGELRDTPPGSHPRTDVLPPIRRIPPDQLLIADRESERYVDLSRRLIIGKPPDGDLPIADRFISGRHAVLELRGDELWVTDLGSTNGTFLNGRQVKEAMVEPGDVIRVGESRITLDRSAASYGDFETLIGQSDPMRQLYANIKRIAAADISVLVIGESGTGKELVARAIHQRSPRRDKPFVAVNCGALTESLAESELFGHEKSSFTGADRQRVGLFEQAHGGTLFLDEVGNLPLPLQVKVLRVLQERELRRVGGNDVLHVDVRVLAATHRDLDDAVEAGTFREDLLYRIRVMPLLMPPLRYRPGDVRRLAEHFFATYARGRSVPRLSEAAWRKLAEHPWPGNVRELCNLAQRIMVLHPHPEEELTPQEVLFDGEVFGAQRKRVEPDFRWNRPLPETELEAMVRMLSATGGDFEAAAVRLGVSAITIKRRLKEAGLTVGRTHAG